LEPLERRGRLSERSLWGADGSVALGDLARGSSLGGRLEDLAGRCVLVATTDQLTAALALIELDGVARRLVLCPPDLPREHVPFVMAAAAVECHRVRSERAGGRHAGHWSFITCSLKIAPAAFERTERYQTEWILLTSGTTGLPKMVVHTLSSLAGAIQAGSAAQKQALWGTFYDIRRYGGLQIFSARAPRRRIDAAVERPRIGERFPPAGRRAWGHPSIGNANSLAQRPDEPIGSQACASIRPPVGRNRRPGSPRSPPGFLSSGRRRACVRLDGSRRGVRSRRRSGGISGEPDRARRRRRGDEGQGRLAADSLGANRSPVSGQPLRDSPGCRRLVDTGDIVELRGERYYFVGRRDGVINVGGQKVHPEEVEAVINSHPQVRISQVRAKKNAIMGALVVADVVLNGETGAANARGKGLEHAILEHCRAALPRHKVPAAINFVLPWPLPRQVRSCAGMRNVLVTGGSRGLGLGIARRLAAAGYRAIAVARKDSDPLRSAMKEAQRDHPGSLRFVAFDLAEIDGIPPLVKALRKEFGRSTGWSTTPRSVSTASSR